MVLTFCICASFGKRGFIRKAWNKPVGGKKNLPKLLPSCSAWCASAGSTVRPWGRSRAWASTSVPGDLRMDSWMALSSQISFSSVASYSLFYFRRRHGFEGLVLFFNLWRVSFLRIYCPFAHKYHWTLHQWKAGLECVVLFNWYLISNQEEYH